MCFILIYQGWFKSLLSSHVSGSRIWMVSTLPVLVPLFFRHNLHTMFIVPLFQVLESASVPTHPHSCTEPFLCPPSATPCPAPAPAPDPTPSRPLIYLVCTFVFSGLLLELAVVINTQCFCFCSCTTLSHSFPDLKALAEVSYTERLRFV